jgi:pimeloyl-ACP methyl ester carboxylesterase
MRRSLLLLVLGLLALPSAVVAQSPTASRHTGFLPGSVGVHPVAGAAHRGPTDIVVDSPATRLVVVYSHGTTNPRQIEDCGAWFNQVPGSIRSQQGPDVLIFYLCSGAREARSTWGTAGEYVYRRVEEIEAVVDALLSAGVSPARIFLAGHSAGGWASLMAAARFGHKLNAVVAFAPAFAGPRAEVDRYPWWWQEARPRQVQELLAAPALTALVFAYDDDPFETPEDLAFLVQRHPGVRLVGYACPDGSRHLTHLRDCREAATASAVAEYLSARAGSRTGFSQESSQRLPSPPASRWPSP